MTMRRVLISALVLIATVSCRPSDERTDEFDVSGGAQSRENMPPDAVAQLDSGTVAFRADDYEEALRHYTRFTELAPEFAAGWFGVYMAQRELGNEAAAEEALSMARSVVPGASLLHSERPDSGT